jgi:hypothetical protein
MLTGKRCVDEYNLLVTAERPEAFRILMLPHFCFSKIIWEKLRPCGLELNKKMNFQKYSFL